ncbi:MAG: hypothetical protein RL186_1596, partial [Pseudomonadota bacterium]
AAQKGLLLVTEIVEGAQGWRIGDPSRLRQVVFNLVSNAVKFTHEGSVRVTLDQNEAGHMIVRVRDTGIGIPPDRLDRLFTKFTQADSSHTRVYGGSGLGLSISKAIVEAMGGRILVTSQAGEGACFELVVPCVCAPPQAEDSNLGSAQHKLRTFSATDAQLMLRAPLPSHPPLASAKQEPDTQPFASLRILVAEDNGANRLVLQTLLSNLGVKPEFVENGRQALDAVLSQHFDVILMDMHMPIMDGLTATRAIRVLEAREGRVRTPLVALTANAMPQQVAEQLAAGVDAHAAKPIQLSVLLDAIEIARAACQRMSQSQAQACADDADRAA